MMTLTDWVGVDPTKDNERLLDCLLKAHQAAARDNYNAISTVIGYIGYVGKPLTDAIATGLLSIGRHHAPLTQARLAIFGTGLMELQEDLVANRLIPGWGNSFFPDQLDPAWVNMATLIEDEYPGIHNRLTEITTLIAHHKGKVIYPNAAAYTAVAAELFELSYGTEVMLLLLGRLPIWAQQWDAVR